MQRRWRIILITALAIVIVGMVGWWVVLQTREVRLVTAIKRGDLAAVEREIRLGADVNYSWDEESGDDPYMGLPSVTWRNLTPVYVAAHDDHADIVAALIEAGANIEAAEGTSGWRPLHIAAMFAGDETILSLVRAGADANSICQGNLTPLHFAARSASADVLHAMIAAGGNVHARDTDGSTPLFWACDEGGAANVQILLDAGADPNTRHAQGQTALIRCAWNYDINDVMQVLVHAGADVNGRDNSGETALMAAAHVGAPETARWLLEHGADPNARDRQGRTAIMHIEGWGEMAATARVLIEHGGDPNVVDNDGRSVESYLRALPLEKAAIQKLLNLLGEAGRQ